MGRGSGRGWARAAARALVVIAVLGGAACSGDDGDGGDADELLTSSTTSTSSTSGTAGASAPDGGDALSLNIAATGMNIVATEVGLKTAQGQGPGYCRDTAPGELQPHRGALEGADDEEVRQKAGAALADLQRAIQQCVAGDADGVRASLGAYNAKFRPLQERIAVLLGG
ncbi:MAG: hypothetical protein ACRD0N_08290 [Acidimicrobiales bacterium]